MVFAIFFACSIIISAQSIVLNKIKCADSHPLQLVMTAMDFLRILWWGWWIFAGDSFLLGGGAGRNDGASRDEFVEVVMNFYQCWL